VIRHLIEHRVATRREVAAATGLPDDRIARAADALLGEGLLVEKAGQLSVTDKDPG
jgi:hypothetical protein